MHQFLHVACIVASAAGLERRTLATSCSRTIRARADDGDPRQRALLCSVA